MLLDGQANLTMGTSTFTSHLPVLLCFVWAARVIIDAFIPVYESSASPLGQALQDEVEQHFFARGSNWFDHIRSVSLFELFELDCAHTFMNPSESNYFWSS